jgi:Family of unknown function (DUF6084)
VTEALDGLARTGVGTPSPEFSVLGAEAEKFTAAPTVVFHMAVADVADQEVYTIALSTQILIDPARRSYDPETRELLVDLFGEPERWTATTTTFQWTRVDALVPSFKGAATFDLRVACTYDLEVAATKYFYSLPGGHVPLTLVFSGTIFYKGDDGRLQLVQIPWDLSAKFRMPVKAWRETIDHHYAASGWIRLHEDTLDRLRRRTATRGLPSFDASVTELLDEAES